MDLFVVRVFPHYSGMKAHGGSEIWCHPQELYQESCHIRSNLHTDTSIYLNFGIMGLLQSRESDGIEQADASTKVIRIERSEIPEEYKTVGISHNVVDRVLNFDKSEDEHIKDLKKQLIEEQEENIKLREHIRHLTESEPALVRKATESFTSDPEEQKHTLETRLDYIEKKYVSDHSENFCKADEEELMDCIKKNRNKVLNCSSFAADFKKCVDSFREKILKEVPQR